MARFAYFDEQYNPPQTEHDNANNIVSITIKSLQDKTKLIKASNNLSINYYGLKAFLNAK